MAELIYHCDGPRPEPLMARETIVVREMDGDRDISVHTDLIPPTSLKKCGWGRLMGQAYSEIRETVDLEAHRPGTVVARVEYDLQAWTYHVRYLVDVEPDGFWSRLLNR